jgi:ABC-type lipoprotein export system ATPase subunit
MSTILTVQDVSYTYVSRYQRVEAVKNVSCTFEAGKFYAIMGRSGSGKSTFLSLLAGLDMPTGGEISFEGKSMSSIDRNRYRRDTASVIYQSYNLFPLLTALENVMYPMELQGKKRREAVGVARKLLEEVGLDEKTYRKFPQMLSGGEQQRVAIARALAVGGKIILADEPTGNLDTANEKMVVKLIQTLAHERGYTAVVVTHNNFVASQADKIYIMSDGELKADAQ